MTQEKWQEIKGMVLDKFDVLENKTVNLDDRPGTVEYIEFTGPLGKMRLEWIDQPLLIDKKTIGSKRIGSDTKVEYIYSETERVNRFKAYKWNNDSQSWEEIEMEKGAFSL